MSSGNDAGVNSPPQLTGDPNALLRRHRGIRAAVVSVSLCKIEGFFSTRSINNNLTRKRTLIQHAMFAFAKDTKDAYC